jgi:hypothetical protein
MNRTFLALFVVAATDDQPAKALEAGDTIDEPTRCLHRR